MNHYTQILIYLKQLAEQDEYVNTVTKDAPADLDLFKANIFPLFNIDIVSGAIGLQVITFTIELTCLDIRDINKEVVNEKFWDNDNEVDNHNQTLAVLNRIWKILKRDFNNNNITTSVENAPVEKMVFEGKNLFDVWSMTFDIEIPNTEINLCKEC